MRRAARWPMLVGLVLALALVDLATGPFSLHEGPPALARAVLVDLRLPRVLLTAVVGACLGLAGTVMQTVLRNPLADPSLLGINAGATFGVLVLLSASSAGPTELAALQPVAALVGALAVGGALLVLGRRGRTTDPERVVVVGLAFTVTLAAIAELLVAWLAPSRRHALIVFLFGSVGLGDWSQLGHAAVLVLAVPLVALAPALDVLALGRESALALGVRVGRVEPLALALAAVLCAVAATLAGDVAFVGLLAPHLARRVVGLSHRARLPAAALLGAALVIAADVVGRVAFRHVDLPIGAVLGCFGVPLFVLVLWRRRAG